MVAMYEDTYFSHDALVMEVNLGSMWLSPIAMPIAEALADMLYVQSAIAGMKNAVLQEVLYPKYQSQENYDCCLNMTAA